MFQSDQRHTKAGGRLCLGNSADWISSWSKDGLLTLRSILNHNDEVCIQAHDPLQLGVRDACVASAGKGVFTLGYDGILKYWDWNFNSNGKRELNQSLVELEQVITVKSKNIKNLTATLANFEAHVDDTQDNAKESTLSDAVENASGKSVVNVEKEVVQLG